ncbi:hypothetical protein GCM10007036_40560 [Alsobacter metallidurans]|uniref:Uncharacterized protein n=1 Tax=Alsobacter metallidurans TaxID=340221 RepID=A0A917MJN5_9HYPH|nr:hypothetical protein GCM10007036_40560 [Alsobacter metallidurans]
MLSERVPPSATAFPTSPVAPRIIVIAASAGVAERRQRDARAAGRDARLERKIQLIGWSEKDANTPKTVGMMN